MLNILNFFKRKENTDCINFDCLKYISKREDFYTHLEGSIAYDLNNQYGVHTLLKIKRLYPRSDKLINIIEELTLKEEKDGIFYFDKELFNMSLYKNGLVVANLYKVYVYKLKLKGKFYYIRVNIDDFDTKNLKLDIKNETP